MQPASITVLNVAYPLVAVGPDAVGGAEQILTRLDFALTRAGHRSIVLACEGSVAANELVPISKPKETLDAAARAHAVVECREAIGAVLASRHVDVVHLHGFDFYEYLPPAGVPVLATLHLPGGWYPPEAFSPQRPLTWLNCVTEAQERTCPPSPAMLGVIENGAPAEFFHTCHAKRDLALALGRISPEAGFHIALEAARVANAAMFLGGEVFGYLEHEKYFRYEILPRLNRFRRFLGPVSYRRKRRLLAGARCLLVPSLAPETSSLVAIEALASGTPVIAFPSGALAEIVQDGLTGFLASDARSMADAIRKVNAIDPRACREYARARYSEELMTSRYLELYGMMAGIARGEADEPAESFPRSLSGPLARAARMPQNWAALP